MLSNGCHIPSTVFYITMIHRPGQFTLISLMDDHTPESIFYQISRHISPLGPTSQTGG